MKHFEETRLLLENSNFYYIIATDMQGNYSYINSHYARAFSYISNNIVGKPYQITMHEDDIKICEQVAAKCFENPDKLIPATIRKHDGKGGYVITQWEYKALFDEDNRPAGIFCLGYDITKFEDEKLQRQHAVSEIQSKSRILQEIAFQQSHVIRAPLANIMGLTSILGKLDIDQNIKNLCEMLVESSRQLDDAIRNIVDLSRKEPADLETCHSDPS